MQFKKYDLNQAQDGDRVMVLHGHDLQPHVGKVLAAVHRVAVAWNDGDLTLFDKTEYHLLIHKPVFLLDDKPVYVGDTVYCGLTPVKVEHDLAPDSPPEVLDPRQWSFALKPKTLNINGFEVPYPETEAPGLNQPYWVADLEGARRFVWEGDDMDLEYLHEGRVHLIEENAQIHTNALLSFFKVKD